MSDMVFEDYSIKAIKAIEEKTLQALEKSGALVETQTKRNSRVDTGQTKGSFRHLVVDSEKAVYIGSNDENAIYEEFGTGEYAIKGNGRKGGWVYRNAKGEYYHTVGKKPSRAFFKAYKANISKCKQLIESTLRGLN